MNQKLLSLACLSLLALAACRPDPAEPVEPTALPDTATAATDASAEIVPSAESLSSDAAPTFDQRAFAGSFSGTLPCASCPGIDTTLALNADGTFALTEDYQGGDVGDGQIDGTWTVEAGDKQIRLDPNSKSAEDRLYAIASNDRIDQLSADGKPAASGLDYSLTRRVAQ
jgi:copper homeostasis protein (lipoprotein)